MATLLYLSAFIFNCVYSGQTPFNLVDLTKSTKAAFYDFDRTILIESFGGKVKDSCIANNRNTSVGCSGDGDMVTALDDFTLIRIKASFGNDTRIAQLKVHFDTMTAATGSITSDANDVGNLYVLSTSWEPIPAVQWEDMIFALLEKIDGMTDYFPRDHILGLDDPGPGIQADKGGKAKETLDVLGITDMNECIFADDKLGNLNWAYCDGTDADGNACSGYGGDRSYCNTLLIQEREGMDGSDMNYFEARTILPAEECESCELCVNNTNLPDDESGANKIGMMVVFILSLVCVLQY